LVRLQYGKFQKGYNLGVIPIEPVGLIGIMLFLLAQNDQYGHSVSVSGDNIIVGAPRDDNSGTDSGSAYAYTPVVTGPNIMVTVSVVPTNDHAVIFGNITELTFLYRKL
jgi:hypothetical protein